MNLFEGVLGRHDGKVAFETPGLAALNPALPEHTPTGEVTVGIRPEDIVLCGAGDPGAISGRVELQETVGPDSYLTLNFGDECTVTVRVPAGDRVAEGKTAQVRFRSGRVRFFGTDGKALTR
ncbi:MAG: TOBE domain-containing protein [Actinomycetia bacterium]|nr:TOBE domain-containing protein [Actinomycetes bacterium]